MGGERLGRADMAARAERSQMEIIFGRAFLVELERGDLEKARVFARAFLHHHATGHRPFA